MRDRLNRFKEISFPTESGKLNRPTGSYAVMKINMHIYDMD